MTSSKRKFAIPLSLIILLLTLSAIVIFFPYYHFLTTTLHVSPLRVLFFDSPLKQIDQTTNILFLGIPGGQHDGPNLSDSLIVVSYKAHDNQLVTIGVPRDIWSSTLQDKINSAYAYGEEKRKGGGLTLAKAEVGAIIGMPIQYAMVINFSEFEKLIDFTGGVDIDVKTSFTDDRYPIAGKEDDECDGDKEYQCRYKTLLFSQGITHMDGKVALQFVRSRNGDNGEGSDFARSARQQLVLTAVIKEILALAKSGDITKLRSLYQNVDNLIVRDITNQELAILAKKIFLEKKLERKNIHLSDEFFITPNVSDYEGKYVLIPADNDFSSVHSYISREMKKQ